MRDSYMQPGGCALSMRASLNANEVWNLGDICHTYVVDDASRLIRRSSVYSAASESNPIMPNVVAWTQAQHNLRELCHLRSLVCLIVGLRDKRNQRPFEASSIISRFGM